MGLDALPNARLRIMPVKPPPRPREDTNEEEQAAPIKLGKIFQAPRGMHDILPEDMRVFEVIRRQLTEIATAYGFEGIELPIVEETELFTKGVGRSSDVVQKQMYSFRTKGGDAFSLRPEATAGIVRAYLEHGMYNLPHPIKLWCWGPMFRYERPQSGRYRQFHQFDMESIGEKNAVLDAQIIQFFWVALAELGISGVNVEINSLGCKTCRPAYRSALVSYFKPDARKLCPDCRRRLAENPLRIFECDKEKCKELVEKAPQIIDRLCEECHDHLKEVLEFLEELGIPYHLNNKLVRGLDYYTKTVFEFWPDEAPGFSLGSGGRYDNLIEILGGRATPAVGFATGIERLMEEIKKRGGLSKIAQPPKQVFLVQLGEFSRRKSLKIFEQLRQAGIRTVESLGRNSIKSQLKVANRLDTSLALIFGQKEALDNTIIIRDMQSGIQETVPLAKLVRELERRLGGESPPAENPTHPEIPEPGPSSAA